MSINSIYLSVSDNFFNLKKKVGKCSVVSDSATPWTVACQGSAVHGISKARTLKWVVISSSRDTPDPRIEPVSPALIDSLSLSHRESPLKRNHVGKKVLKIKTNVLKISTFKVCPLVDRGRNVYNLEKNRCLTDISKSY